MKSPEIKRCVPYPCCNVMFVTPSLFTPERECCLNRSATVWPSGQPPQTPRRLANTTNICLSTQRNSNENNNSLTALLPSSKMSEDRKFASKDELVDWLRSRGAAEGDARAAAQVLYPDFDEPDALLGISSDDLKSVGLSIPLAMKLRNKLSQQQRKRDASIFGDAENTELRKRIAALEMQDSRAVSYADYYREKDEQLRILVWVPPDCSDDDLPQPLQGKVPVGAEKGVVKPFWKNMLQNHTIIEGISNGYEMGYVGTKIPDVAFYPTSIARPTAREYIAVGDCKGSDWRGTAPTEKGQLMLYGHRILDAQPERQHVYGFLTNNEHTVLIRATRSTESPFGVVWGISAVMTFEEGMKSFLHLVNSDHDFFPPPTINGNTLQIRKELRPGGTCRAFASTFGTRVIVAKLYQDTASAANDNTRLKMARETVGRNSDSASEQAQLPSPLELSGRWLLISPLGERFTARTFKLHHLKKLLRTLQLIHERGLVHWDVRFSNIFYLPATEDVLLNDWGSSTSRGQRVLVCGCPPPFCHPELVDVVDAVPDVKHDLYSLVFSTGKLLFEAVPSDGRLLSDAFSAAENGDYDGILEEFRTILS